MKNHLVEQAQSSYIQLLAAEVEKNPRAHVEPAMRKQDGELATEGRLELPCRLDLIARDGTAAGTPITVSSRPNQTGGSEAARVRDCQVFISDFAWDALSLAAQGVPPSAFDSTCREWFLRWFDMDDSNPASALGLYGVVHFMSDPVDDGVQIKAHFDLGSAPVAALAELIEELASKGASAVHLE
jgi:hypothetical protein